MRYPRCLVLAVLVTAGAPPLGAQWQAGRDLPLVTRAVDARLGRDTGRRLGAWRASAHGLVRFALVVDHDGVPFERVVRADELRLEVYGEAPNRSKQRIVAWRDTTLFPNTVVYHRDHLGIVAHDFGPTIRLGEGDEVRDVPHPLSPRGLDFYQFRPGATVALTVASGTVHVRAVAVRPRLADSAGAVGTLYLDTERGALVRFAFTFTGAAYRDATVDRIGVVLENALIDGTTWLPWHQMLEIRRADPVLGLPMGSVLRAEWDIDDYRLDERLPPETFVGARLDGPASPGVGSWPAPWAAALAESDAGQDALDAAVDDAGRLVGRQLLSGLPRLRWLGDSGLSGVVRANRVEGLRLGGGATLRLGRQVNLVVSAGWGTADHRLGGGVALRWPVGATVWHLRLSHELVDIDDDPRASRLANTFQVAAGGHDLGDWRLRDRAGIGVEWRGDRLRLGLDVAAERHRSVEARFRGLGGSLEPNPGLGYGDVLVARLGATLPAAPGWRLALEHGEGDHRWTRATLAAAWEAPGGFTVAARGGIATAGTPVARSFALGGRGWLVAVPDRSVGGRRMLVGRLARPIPVGWSVAGPARWGGRIPLVREVTPFVATGLVGGALPSAPWRATRRHSTVLGVAVTLGDPILRIEWSWDPAEGGMRVTVDADRFWWPLL